MRHERPWRAGRPHARMAHVSRRCVAPIPATLAVFVLLSCEALCARVDHAAPASAPPCANCTGDASGCGEAAVARRNELCLGGAAEGPAAGANPRKRRRTGSDLGVVRGAVKAERHRGVASVGCARG